ncbi:MAG: outer membrane protein transport protein [Myxococcales bacterium]|nr:outer membrane protein transport protein [Myxococcales bacterium]MDH3486327.1 outer membrane protein transport protein [Myxococcales bacterium]
MRRASLILLIGAVCVPVPASAGNSDEVNGGLDVTLTGGAVVAITYTGAALWYNPAGLARTTKASLELTGVTVQLQMVKMPGLSTIDTDPQAKSEGKTVNFSVVPQAITFTIGLRENLKLGVGLFNSSIRRAFITEQVTTAPGITPEARAVGGQNSKIDFFHVSGGLAGTLGNKQKLLLGGAFDFVVASSRVDGTQAIFYNGGESGFFTDGDVGTQTGFGLQLKAGIQWVPIPEVRIGLSAASPTFAFVILERFANTFAQSPPVGITLPPDDPNAQSSGGSESRGAKGGWWGVEPGNLRFGIAYVGDWGWVEADLFVQWRLRTPDLQIDRKATFNGRIGSAIRLTRFMHLGLGLFTDLSPVDQLGRTPPATIDVNFYGVHLGFLFANHEMHPGRPEAESETKDGAGFAIAIGLRYSHGRGQALGFLFPAQYDPSSITRQGTDGKINEIALNLGVNVSF